MRLLACALLLAACSESPAGAPDAAPDAAPPDLAPGDSAAPRFPVGGTVVGLLGGSVALQNAGGDTLMVSTDGAFQFATPLASGAGFDVTVSTQPSAPAQRCMVSAGRGTVAERPIASVVVNCVATTFTIGGVVRGLGDGQLVLADPGLPKLTLDGDGGFAFAAPVTRGTNYWVTIESQPAGKNCRVAGASGAVVDGDVTSVVVECAADRFTVGGSVNGLHGRGLVLQNNGGDDLRIAASGAFAFPTPAAAGDGYAVTVARAPGGPSQTCTIALGSGTIAGDVSSVSVTCVNDATDWLQFNFDEPRSGWNVQESLVDVTNVALLAPQKSVTLPAIADCAPVYLRAQPGVTSSDLLFVTTKDGATLAIDADTLATVWTAPPAGPAQLTTSCPAIDPGRRFIYANSLDGLLHKLAIADGAETLTGGWPQVSTLKPDVEKASASLTVAAGFLYATTSSFHDAGDYQGHVTAVALATGAQTVFNALCSDQPVHLVKVPALPGCTSWEAGIWGRGGVSYHAELGRTFVTASNGPFDGVRDWGNSVLALSPDLTTLYDSYTPPEYPQLNAIDADLGSAEPALLPTPPRSRVLHLAVQGGKDALLRLIDLDDLSGTGKLGALGGELQILPLPQGLGVLPAIAVWVDPEEGSDWIFVATNGGLAGIQIVVDTAGAPSMVTRWTLMGYGGTSPIIAGGVVYYATYAALLALGPTDGRRLWTDYTVTHLHWESPIIVNGRLYLADEDSKLTMFALP